MRAKECRDDQKFKVCCHAGDSDHLELASDSVLVQIEQRIRRAGKEEMWVCLQVKCKEQEDGSLATQVVICNPDWDEPLRMLRGKSNVNTLAVMPLVACATPSAVHRALCSRSR